MSEIQDTVYIDVEYFDDEDGQYYVATSQQISIVTDSETLGELLANVALHLEDLDTIKEFNLVPNPRIKLIMELPENYAEIA